MSDGSPLAMSAEEDAAFAAMQDDAPVADQGHELEAEGQDEGEQAEVPSDGKQLKKPALVPSSRLREETQRRQAAEKELQQAREERARFDERLKIVQERQQQADRPDADEIPDPEADPIGFLKWQRDQTLKDRQERAKSTQQTEAQRQSDENMSRFMGAYKRQADTFAAENPDFMDAYAHATKARVDDYLDLGLSENQAIQRAKQDEIDLAHSLMQQGINPAERIMAFAKRRGWSPKVAEQDAEERVTRTREATTRNKSLSQAGGGSPATEMTAERLIAMSPEEFDAWTSKNSAKAKRLMGG